MAEIPRTRWNTEKRLGARCIDDKMENGSPEIRRAIVRTIKLFRVLKINRESEVHGVEFQKFGPLGKLKTISVAAILGRDSRKRREGKGRVETKKSRGLHISRRGVPTGPVSINR